MILLEENTLNYMTPMKFCPRNAFQFIIDANRAEREALADWCDENGLDLRITQGIGWGRALKIAVIAFNKRDANQFRAYLAEHEPEAPTPQLDLSTPLPADPLAAWAVAALAEMKSRTGGAHERP